MAEQLPEITSQWLEASAQLKQLGADLERAKSDVVVAVAMRDGLLDVRGFGAVTDPLQAVALLNAAAQQMLGLLNQQQKAGRKLDATLAEEVDREFMALIDRSIQTSREAEAMRAARGA